MRVTWEAIAFTLAAILLVFVTYFALVGADAALTDAKYVQCPLCHHHYLVRDSAEPHECPHGFVERTWARMTGMLRHGHAPVTH